MVQELLNAGAYVGKQGRHCYTPLIQASHRGYTDIVKALLTHGSDVNARNEQGCTALHLAASAGRRDVINVLLAKGADPSDPGETGFTPMDLAVQEGYPGIKQLLLKHIEKSKAKKKPRKVPSSLQECARSRDAEGIRYLLRRGADPNSRDSDGCTAIHHSVAGMCPATTALLLASGADPTLPYPHEYGHNDHTPLKFVYQTTNRSRMPNGFSPGFSNPEVVRNLGQLRAMLLRAGAYTGLWRWPVDVNSSRQLPAAADKRSVDGEEGELSSECSETNMKKVGMMLVRLERDGRLRLQRRVLWNGLFR